MFSTALFTSKREHRQSQGSESTLPLSASFVGAKRTFSTVSVIPTSISCPHLPQLGLSTSSQPTVTSAVAFGSTTPTTEIFLNTCGEQTSKVLSLQEITTPTRRRLSMTGFSWESQSTTGRMSPAAELTGNIARRSQPTTPPGPVLSKSEPSTGFLRGSPKSNLRLKLPPTRADATSGALEQQSPSFDLHTYQQSLLAGQSFLGPTYPATPDFGLLKNSPVLFEGRKDGEHVHPRADEGGGGGGGIGGVATSTASNVMLQAGAHNGRGGLALLTPPDDNGILDWQQDGIQRIQADGEATVRMTDIPALPEARTQTTEPMKSDSDADKEADKSFSDEESKQNVAIAAAALHAPDPNEVETDQNKSGDDDWIKNAMETLIGSAFPTCMATEAVRVLSYTLPCPLPDVPGPEVTRSSSNPVNPDRLPFSAASAPSVASAAGEQLSPLLVARCTSKLGGVAVQFNTEGGTTTALHHLTAAVQRRYINEGSSSVYIHVSHVIDSQTSLSRLPSTPPITSTSFGGTGGFHEGGGGYFSPTVFNSIVVAPNSAASTPTGGAPIHARTSTLPSWNPILPPNSLHLTLLERYIPPASQAEDAAMFSTRSSILIDRLFELSPNGGSLIFIYPTKTGAQNFDRDYLGPVLDPLLRKLMVLYALPQQVMWGIRNMASTCTMAEYATLLQRVMGFCSALTNGEGDLPCMPTKLVYSSKVTVSLNELSWREWWTQQEQMRIRDLVKKCVSIQSTGETRKTETGGRSAFWHGYGVPGDLAREVLDGVKAPTIRPSSKGMGDAVLASSMSGSGSAGGVGAVGAGRIPGGESRLGDSEKRSVEVGVFILRRGTE